MNVFDKEKLLLVVGERIRRMRLLQDRTTKEIAAHLNITTQAYGNMERGKADISLSRLMEIAVFFDIPLTKLISEDHFTAMVQF